MIFNNKRIIFIGPMGNPTKDLVDTFDIVVRTNNFFGMDQSHLHSKRCDVLLVNFLYANKYHHIIIRNFNNVKCIVAKSTGYTELIEKLSKKLDPRIVKKKVICLPEPSPNAIRFTKTAPLVGMHFLDYILQNHKPAKLYYSGIDFYQSNATKFPKGYIVKERQGKDQQGAHNVSGNIQYFKYCLKNYKSLNCEVRIRQIIGVNP